MFAEIFSATTTFAQVSNGSVNPFNSFVFWLLVFIGLIFSIAIHEFAHAWSAHLLGDDTARMEGRLTLNPFRHFDVFGFLLILFVRFGYGKPVPVNPNNFANPIQGNMYVSLAGPASNLLQAAIYAVLFMILKHVPLNFSPALTTFIWALPYIGFINLSLAVFNLLPFPPLDGSKIWGYFNNSVNEFIYRIAPYSILLLLLFIFPLVGGQSILGLILNPIANVYFGVINY